MSAPSVAEANPMVTESPSQDSKTSTRRRNITITEKLNGGSSLEGGGVLASANVKAGGERDLSHSVRGEIAVERSKDLLQTRRTLVQSTISPRRRKSVMKPEKPRWKTIISIFTKNLVLFFVLFLVGQFLWTLFQKTENGSIVSSGMSNFERRMSEVEKFMKTTVKMLQVQVDAVDKKLEGGIGNLREELRRKDHEKNLMLESALNKLGTRTDNLEKSFDEIKHTSFSSKDDFEAFVTELVSKKGFDGRIMDFNLDDIKAYARETIIKEIEKHAADGLGRVDYALASSGAKIVRHSEPFSYGKGGVWFSIGNTRNKVHEMAKKMLEPSFGEPGQCFALKGSTGFVEIRLRTAIIPEAITLEHVAKSISYDRSSAPKECQVSAWLQGHEDDPSSKRFGLVEFTYDLDESNVQTFDVESSNASLVNMVRLDILSNHGCPSHTCIYRLRVHGHEPDSLPTLPIGP